MEYIASQENLEAFVRRAASSSVLAIDTEFLREKTYYANLCLIQLATDAEVAVVDPFAIEDMKVLAPLLTDSSIVKLFHAGGQDLEILYRELGVLPAPLFDTQVAATLLGHTQQIGYGDVYKRQRQHRGHGCAHGRQRRTWRASISETHGAGLTAEVRSAP